MGKKTKKNVAGNKSTKKQAKASTGAPRSTQSDNKSSGRDSEQTSLYKIYKHCTEAVIQWGKATHKRRSKKGKNNSNNTLSHVIFDILGALASDGVLMPEAVLADLKLAISYRKRVGRFYRLLPQVSEDDHARHEWLIQQLEQLARAFRKNTFLACGDEEETEMRAIREGFQVLAFSDDEESVASSQGDDTVRKSRVPKTLLKTPPTAEELEAEERLFAISLLMCEVDEIRNNLRDRWRKWAKRPPPHNDNEGGKDLLAITACTGYALSAVRKTILQLSIMIDLSDDDVDQIIGELGPSSSALKPTNEQETFKEDDLVTIHSLVKQPDLNGRNGRVCEQLTGGANNRLKVQLFPSNGYEIPAKEQAILVKPDNILLSDTTYRRLCQIQAAVGSFNISSTEIPPPEMTFGATPSQRVQAAGVSMITMGEVFNRAIIKQDFEALLRLMVHLVLPSWISLSRYLPDAGAADSVLVAYIRDFFKSRKLKFPLAFALLITMDGALACASGRDNVAESTRDLFVRILEQLVTAKVYTPAIRLLERSGKKGDALYAHFEFIKHIREEYSLCGLFFPLVTGELLLTGLRMHFVCGSGLPYTFVEHYTNVLHIYWMLRSEGFLGRIAELESTIIGNYRQHVFFRGGLAKKGQEAYLKCQQLAIGVSAQAVRLLDGRAVRRQSGRMSFNQHALGRDGLHVSEISRLLDVLQWKSMPIVDKEACFTEIEHLARQEYTRIFSAPFLCVSVKLSKLVDYFESTMIERARRSGAQMMPNFADHTSRMTPIDLVCLWALSLGDDRSLIPGEKETSLSLLASYFTRIFDTVEPIVPEEKPTLLFSPNEHTVDSTLWGEKGTRKVEHLEVL